MRVANNPFEGDWASTIMPHVDYFVLESDQQSGHWRKEIDYDNSLAEVVGC